MVIVGMEYLVGNAFAYYTKKTGKRIISIKKLREYEETIKKYWSKKGINAIFKGTLKEVAEEYEDWFLLLTDDNAMVLKSQKTVIDLNNRFLDYLPFQVINSFIQSENTKELAKE